MSFFANNEQASVAVFTAVFCFTHAKHHLIKLKQEKRKPSQQSRLFIIFLNVHLSQAFVIDSKYITMTGLQDFF